MKNNLKLLGIIALVAVIVSVTGCVTASSIGGTSDPHGLISQGNLAVQGTEIASYMVIMYILDQGYDAYDAAVKAAEAEGKQITTITTWYFVFTRTTAYAK